ncbi:MAG: hypothetical protein WA191_22640 [Telluria sp.]|nr:hypothetical protein [Telluria sp.]
MVEMQSFLDVLRKSGKLSLSLPFLRYEMDLGQVLDSKTVDERLAKLDQIRNDLSAAVDAVAELQREAQDNKTEAEALRDAVVRLEQDKVTAETLLKVPEDSFARMLARANSKARFRGIVEGTVIGLVTGALSSFLIWYMTR